MAIYDIKAACEAQKRYCEEKGYPHFAPNSGYCFRCHANIYTDHKDYDGYVSSGISVEAAGNNLVTGCPHCHYSFCE